MNSVQPSQRFQCLVVGGLYTELKKQLKEFDERNILEDRAGAGDWEHENG